MRSSLVISLVLHGLILGALFVEWHGVSRIHFPQKVYSVRVLGSLRVRTSAGASAKHDEVKVAAPKEAPKPKAPRKEEPKVAVPKKPGKNPKAKAKEKVAAAAPAEQRHEAAGGAGAGSGAGASNGAGITVDAAQFPFSYFLAAIERKVSDNWYSAVSQGASGLTCVVYFRLMRNGSVQDVRVETSSGNGFFDSAALRAVRSGAPFPPLPGGFPDDFLGIHFTFAQKE